MTWLDTVCTGLQWLIPPPALNIVLHLAADGGQHCLCWLCPASCSPLRKITLLTAQCFFLSIEKNMHLQSYFCSIQMVTMFLTQRLYITVATEWLHITYCRDG